MADPKTNQYAQAALRERRAEISGEIVSLERRLRYLRETLVHIDATLRLFDPDAEPNSIPPKKPYKRVKLFGAGNLNRLVLSALSKGGRPMALPEIVDAVVAETGFGPDAAKTMTNRVRGNLNYLVRSRGLVAKDGERETARWKIVG